MAETEETQKGIGTETVMAAEGERKKRKRHCSFTAPRINGEKKLLLPFRGIYFPSFLCGKVRARDTRKKVAKNEAAAGSIFLHRSPPPLLISLLFVLSPTSM